METQPMRSTCRQCRMMIVAVELGRNYHAQQRGFCCDGCEEVFDAIHAADYSEARKGMENL